MKIIIDKIVKNCYHNIVEIKKTYNLKLNIKFTINKSDTFVTSFFCCTKVIKH